jgi:hypothetical protein
MGSLQFTKGMEPPPLLRHRRSLAPIARASERRWLRGDGFM